MAIRQIVYLSTGSPQFDQEAIEHILTASRRNNAESGISGVLYFHAGFFVQLLEGEADVVQLTFARIERDERHQNLRLVYQGDADRRLFEQWSMAYVLGEAIDLSWFNALLTLTQSLDQKKHPVLDSQTILSGLAELKRRLRV